MSVSTDQQTRTESRNTLAVAFRLLISSVLPVWEDVHAREAASQACRRILDDFVASSVHLAAPLKHQAFLIRRYDGAAYLLSWRTPHLELISFHVPAGAAERRMFEHAYGAFIELRYLSFPPSTLFPSHLPDLPSSTRDTNDSWQQTNSPFAPIGASFPPNIV